MARAHGRQRGLASAGTRDSDSTSWCRQPGFHPLPIVVESTRRKVLISWQKRAAARVHGFESRRGHEFDFIRLFGCGFASSGGRDAIPSRAADRTGRRATAAQAARAGCSDSPQAGRAKSGSQRGRIPASLKLPRTRSGVPQSFHPMPGNGETTRKGGQASRTALEKLACGARA